VTWSNIHFGRDAVYGFDLALDEGDKDLSQQVWRGTDKNAEDTRAFGGIVIVDAPAGQLIRPAFVNGIARTISVRHNPESCLPRIALAREATIPPLALPGWTAPVVPGRATAGRGSRGRHRGPSGPSC